MSNRVSGEVLRQVGRLYGTGTVAGLTDGQLLDRFLDDHDEVAFEALVVRHGPMVLGVCQGVLKDPADAADAFQAAFLVLVRKAGSIRGREAIGGWLHRVTYRIALKARKNERRRPEEVSAGEVEPIDLRNPGPDAAASLRELRALLHEEFDRLPERYRAPILLCDLQGLTHDEAARRLRWPIGTVKGRLSRAREQLKTRLIRRGVTVPAGLVGASLLKTTARAAVPDALRLATIKAGMAASGGSLGGLAAGIVSFSSLTLAQGALRTMWMAKLKTAALGATLLAGAVAGGTGWLAASGQGVAPGEEPPPAPATTDPQGEGDLARLQGVWFRTSSSFVTDEQQPQIQRFEPGEQPIILVVQGDGFHFGGPGETPESVVDNDPEQVTLDESTWPKRIRLLPNRPVPEPGTAGVAGVYRLTGDTLTLALGWPNDPPDSFEPVAPAHFVDVYQRVGTENDVEAEVDAPEPAVGSALEQLQGRWRVVALETGGRRTPLGDDQRQTARVAEGDRLNGDLVPLPKQQTVWVIEGDRVTVEAGGKPVDRPQRLRLGPEETPRAIDLEKIGAEPGTRPALGIYRIVHDTLEICLSGDPDERPTDFRTPDGANWVIHVLRREGAPPASPATREITEHDEEVPPPALDTPAAPPASPAVDRAALARRQAELDLLELEVEADERAIQELMDLERRNELPEAPATTDSSTPESREARQERADYHQALRRHLVERQQRYLANASRLAEEKHRLEADAGPAQGVDLARGGEIELSPLRKARPGDRIVVEVLEALPARPIRGERVVRSDGTLHLGFYGNLLVAGLTDDEIKVRLVEHLRTYLNDDALGLIVDINPETGEEIRIPPAESDRLYVENTYDASMAARQDEEFRAALDRVLRRLEQLERRLR